MGSNLIIEKSEFELVKGFDTNLTVSEDKGIIMDLILKKEKFIFKKIMFGITLKLQIVLRNNLKKWWMVFQHF